MGLRRGLKRLSTRGEGDNIAVVQVSPAFQANGCHVNYGDYAMTVATKQALEKRGFHVHFKGRSESGMSKPQRLRKARLFIDLAGFVYSQKHKSSVRSSQAAEVTLDRVRLFKQWGAKTVIAPQTLGPFGEKNGSLAKACSRLFDEASELYARDSVSLANAISLCPQIEDKAKIAPDTALVYESSKDSGSRATLENLGLVLGDRKKPVVGITLNRQINDRDKSYLTMMERLIRLLKKRGDQVVLIPHERGRYRNERDDQFLSRSLCERTSVPGIFSDGRRTYETERDYIEGIEAAHQHLDLLVAGRFHALIRGVAYGIPTLSVSWAHKYENFYRGLGLEAEEHILSSNDIEEDSTGESSCAKLDRFMDKLEENASLFKEKSEQERTSCYTRFFDAICTS